MTTAHPESSEDRLIEVFYDGACPLCVREVRFLRRLDRKRRIRFTDIATADFQPSDYGKTIEAFMSETAPAVPSTVVA